MPLVYTLSDMEEAGIEVQSGELMEYGNRLQVRIEEVEQKIYDQADQKRVFNGS